jgi:hypothetical protein
VTSAVLVVVVRAADVAIEIVAVVVLVVLVVRVVRAVVPVAAAQVAVVRAVRATRWAPVVREDQAAIAVLVVRVPIVARVVLVVPVVRRTDSSRLALPVTQPGKMQRRSSRASAPMASRCRRATSAPVSRSARTQMAWAPTESRGIPSVARSARPSVAHPVIPR